MDAFSNHGGNVDAFTTGAETSFYDQFVSVGLFPQEAYIIDRYFTDGGSVLDVGCGAGRTTRQLADRGFDVVGIDVSDSIIEVARQNVSDVELAVADAAALPFPDDAFDHVLFSYNGLDYLYPAGARRRALSEIHRVLEPGGVFAFSSHNSWYRFPAVFIDQQYLWKYYLGWSNGRRLFQPYKLDDARHATKRTYFSNPLHQRRQLRRHEFEMEAIVGKRTWPLSLFEFMAHYIARSR